MKPELLHKIVKLTAAYEAVDGLHFVVVTPDGFWAGLGSQDGLLKVTVNCNDLFYWACSDSEDIVEEDLPLLEECLKIDYIEGLTLFACKKRGMRPQNCILKKTSDELKPLYEACGPERDE